MKIKALTICLLLGTTLASGQASAWFWHSGQQVKPHKPHRGHHHHAKTYTQHVYVKKVVPTVNNWHKHPVNPFTKDTHHSHANGLNHHVHNYGKGPGRKPLIDKVVTFTSLCPYTGH